MKLGIMQPYFFPYLGYWQLMNAVDRYVVYDDVNFIKGGRINRNAILLQGQSHTVNLILRGASPNKLINQVQVDTQDLTQTKLLRTIGQAYAKAPFFADVMPVLEKAIRCEEENLARYLLHTFRVVNEYLGIRTELVLSSDIEKNNDLKGYEKVIEICTLTGADCYYNAIGGVELYEPHRDAFEAAGIELRFLEMEPVQYTQFRNEFVPNLSIIDVMMFNSPEQIRNLLEAYQLR